MVCITIIIPTFNESKFIKNCLRSFDIQNFKNFEVIVVDDGSTDNTQEVLQHLQKLKWKFKLIVLKQRHSGPGVARNYAASKAEGEILLFIDADMTFESDFLEKITEPLRRGSARGVDSQAGILGNSNNYWARCWNLGKFSAAHNYSQEYLTDITPDKKNFGGIFRAILKKEFVRVGGFETDGDYTDDSSLGRKLGYKAKIVQKGKFYHWNPDTISEVWIRARWIGKGKYFTSTLSKRLFNLIKFFPLISPFKGFFIGLKFKYPKFVFFKILYDTAVWVSIIEKI